MDEEEGERMTHNFSSWKRFLEKGNTSTAGHVRARMATAQPVALTNLELREGPCLEPLPMGPANSEKLKL